MTQVSPAGQRHQAEEAISYAVRSTSPLSTYRPGLLYVLLGVAVLAEPGLALGAVSVTCNVGVADSSERAEEEEESDRLARRARARREQLPPPVGRIRISPVAIASRSSSISPIAQRIWRPVQHTSRLPAKKSSRRFVRPSRRLLVADAAPAARPIFVELKSAKLLADRAASTRPVEPGTADGAGPTWCA